MGGYQPHHLSHRQPARGQIHGFRMSLEHDLPGHLLRYPIGVASEGDVTELLGVEFFPDTKARILRRHASNSYNLTYLSLLCCCNNFE